MSDDDTPKKDGMEGFFVDNPNSEWDDHMHEIDGTAPRKFSPKVGEKFDIADIIEIDPEGWAGENHDDKVSLDLPQESQQIQSAKVELPPGSTMLKWADFVFPEKFVDRMLTNEVRDMCVDYFDALDNDRPLKRKWVLMRGHAWCVICIFAGLFAVYYDKIVSSIKKMKF